MARVRYGPTHRLLAQAHADLVDALGEAGATIVRRGVEIPLDQRQRLRPRRAQRHELDPEAGVEIVEPGGEQPGNVSGIAAGGGRLEGADEHLAVDLPQAQLEAPGALAARLERA